MRLEDLGGGRHGEFVAERDEIRGFIPPSRCTWDEVMDVEIACLFARSAVAAAVFITREHGYSSPRPCIATRPVDAHQVAIGLRSRVLNLSSKRDAAKLWGAVCAAEDALGFRMLSVERQRYEQRLAQLETTPSWREGNALTLEEAHAAIGHLHEGKGILTEVLAGLALAAHPQAFTAGGAAPRSIPPPERRAEFDPNRHTFGGNRDPLTVASQAPAASTGSSRREDAGAHE